ncbi:hypothetical protein HPB51_001659 [Rhipicephalus microplus]|uniref:THAP-type domain-containing protein n=1 Tax=Rhipicephalus microplus TaxID=6941 RepID=A0A9J6EVW0_RHIMP|nr:hypothetical protein HPB51_001659 [Rhipicephalus microplus]
MYQTHKMCFVPQCIRRAVNGDVSLHTSPSDNRVKKKWIVKLRIGKPVAKTMMVCSAHFVPEDFFWGTAGLLTADPLDGVQSITCSSTESDTSQPMKPQKVKALQRTRGKMMPLKLFFSMVPTQQSVMTLIVLQLNKAAQVNPDAAPSTN